MALHPVRPISRRRGRRGSVALVVVGMLLGSLLITPANAHVGGVGHLWNAHIKARVIKLLSLNDGTINQAGDPVHWTRLKGVPAGFADGADDIGDVWSGLTGVPAGFADGVDNVSSTASDIACTGCVGTTDLADDAVTIDKIAAGAVGTSEIADNSVSSTDILDSTVDTADLAAGSVTTSRIADDAVTTGKILDGTVGAADIGTDGVGSAEIAAGAVGTSELADDSVTTGKIAAGAVGTSDLADDSVTTGKIAAGAVGTSDLADDSVTTGKIAAGAVGTTDLADDSVTTGKIGTGEVGTTDLADNAVTNAKMADNAVGNAEMADNAVTTTEILDGTITGDDLAADIQVETARTYSGAGSFQLLAADLTLGAGAGTSDPGDTDFLGAAMGNVLGADLTNTHNYVGGLIGHYSVTGTNASTYPVGAVLAGVSDGSTTADGAVVAYIDGDTTPTTAGAAFKVMSNNSTPTSGFDFGLDLQDAAHDGYLPVDEAFYKKGLIRMPGDVIVLVKNGTPTASDGAGNAGPGSLLIDRAAALLYINTGTMATPAWTVV